MNPRLTVIDTDIHPTFDPNRVPDFLPQHWQERWKSGHRAPGDAGWWNPNGVLRRDAVTDDGTRIESRPDLISKYFMDPYSIEYGILNFPDLAIALHPDLDYAAAMVSAHNDILIQDWLPADPRFRGSMLVAPYDPHLAVKEIHRVGSHPGVVQVLMPSGATDPYGHRRFHPIYEAAAEHGLPVAIHPGSEGRGVAGSPTSAGWPSSYLERHTVLTANALAHAVSLVTEGVFVKFPKLKFVLVECGVFWLIPLLWRLDKNWKGLRQLTPWLDRSPSEIFQEHVFLTTQPIEEPPHKEFFQQMLGMLDFGKNLMFSTDFPHWDGDTPDFAARWFPESIRPRIMSETARELYGLPNTSTGNVLAPLSAQA